MPPSLPPLRLLVCAALLAAAPSPAAPRAEDAMAPPERVVDGLEALYTFEGDVAGTIPDRSGVEPALDLRIDRPQAVRFHAGRMAVQAPVVIASDGPAGRLTSRLRQAQQFTLEAWVTPADGVQTGPARIVSLSLDTSKRSLTLAQDKSRYDLRLRTSATSDNGTPSTPAPDGSAATRRTHVVATRTPDGVVRLLLDGREVARNTVAGDMNRWPDDCRLVLVNEIGGERPWYGEVALVAIYSRALADEEIARNHRAGPPMAVEGVGLPPRHPGPVDFVTDILPLLRERCFGCHSGEEEAGGLNLGIRGRALAGGHHGPLLEPGDAASSRLLHALAGVGRVAAMPPEGPAWSAPEIGLVRAWIEDGARWPAGHDVPDPREARAREHWAFRPLVAPTPPTPRDAAWPRGAIDRFVLARLEAEGIAPAALAPARVLARRIHAGLTGLPPTPERVDAFAAAHAADPDGAVDRVVEELLADVAHGEHRARHWLDVARYADSDGQESDRDRPTAWRYRDACIRAFHEDLPFDRFVRRQIAGDELEPAVPDAVAATGFLAAGPFAALPDRLMEDERLRNRYNELDDTLTTIGTGFLGLTLGCVRCHDHKYDHIPARDYYGLMAALHGGERAEIPLAPGSPDTVLGWRDLGPVPRPTWLFQRGDWYDRDQPVGLGFVSVLTRGRPAGEYLAAARAAAPEGSSTLQRAALAAWLTDVEEGAGALVARVIVNRVWQQHFGAGLVRTPGDFGVRADAPSHPDLLEWLAADLVEHGWSLKRLDRQIVTSRTYRQASAARTGPDGTRLDPDDRLLARFPPGRLTAEGLRDALLSVAGTLDRTPFGPAVKAPVPAEAIVARNLKDPWPADLVDGPGVRRRSIYLFHKRVVPNPLLQAFDKPDAQATCGRRDRTTVAPQALALLNDPFVRTVAAEFAARVAAEAGPDPAARVRRAFRLALSREPGADEQADALAFLAEQAAEGGDAAALRDFCQVLQATNEFFHVE